MNSFKFTSGLSVLASALVLASTSSSRARFAANLFDQGGAGVGGKFQRLVEERLQPRPIFGGHVATARSL
jgi:hypothetical protein